eukprot:scaffold192440_cov27-Prasinocladus_malaysianus.AAC.1
MSVLLVRPCRCCWCCWRCRRWQGGSDGRGVAQEREGQQEGEVVEEGVVARGEDEQLQRCLEGGPGRPEPPDWQYEEERGRQLEHEGGRHAEPQQGLREVVEEPGDGRGDALRGEVVVTGGEPQPRRAPRGHLRRPNEVAHHVRFSPLGMLVGSGDEVET